MHLLSLIGLVFCLFMGHAVAEEHSGEQLNELHRQYLEQYWSYLETSQYEQLRVASAIRLLRTDNPSKKARGLQLISDVLKKPDIDPAVLWSIAWECRWRTSADWCESGEALTRLQKADPKNGAIQLLKLGNENQTLSDDKKQQLLATMADAERFDIYWARGAVSEFEEALKFVKTNAPPPSPPGLPVDLLPHVHAYILSTSFSAINTAFFFTEITFSDIEIREICKEQATRQHAKGIQSCNRLARIMQNNSRTLLSRSTGLGLEKNILEITNPDDPKVHSIALRKEAQTVMNRCFAQLWAGDPNRWPSVGRARMINYFKNLDELGEWEGLKLTLMQEYEFAPEDYPVNPARCNEILEMDDETLDRFMDGRSATEVWEQMLADAKLKSQE